MVLSFIYSNACIKVLILFWRVTPTETTSMCDGPTKCCDGFMWDTKKKDCEKCIPGYIGPNCTIQCTYPTYGERCQGYCDCEKIICNVSTGCPNKNTAACTTKKIPLSTVSKQATTEYFTSTMSELFTKAQDLISGDSGSHNVKRKLIYLIQIFGGVDILLICTYMFMFVNDRRGGKRMNQTENTRQDMNRNSPMYDDIEMVFI